MREMAKPPDTYPEEVRDTFEYCTDCEKVVASVDQHTCTDGDSGNGKKSAAERARLAALDDRPHSDDVLYPEGRSENHAWAYHELENGEPLHEVDYDAGHQVGPREDAINRGCYPCGTCRLIQDRRDDADEGEDDG